MSVNRPDRRIITFYSFKGGVGRSMALANVAFRLANTHGLRVIAVDWDLEAPGMHRFFGVSAETAGDTRGVLDYFIEWREALERNDRKPPDVTGWILPIREKPHAPRFGSLSLLLAGRLGADYDERLASLDWRSLYEDSAGAAAVETLREQLVATADVVLIDSRTGHTDAGGICTIQLPDAVVLMTAPNEQSLEGVEQIARRIASASEQERAGRTRSKVWLSVARVPSVEESYLADVWFKEHEAWFSALTELGLWRKDDHSEGLKSFEIPHRGRWGVGETLFSNPMAIRLDDPLFLAYDRLTKTLFRWLTGMNEIARIRIDNGQSAEERRQRIEALRIRVAEAEERGDAIGLTRALFELGLALSMFEQQNEALNVLDRASAAAIGANSHTDQALVFLVKGNAHLLLGRQEKARSAYESALSIANEAQNSVVKGVVLLGFGSFEIVTGNHDTGLSALTEGLKQFRASGLEDKVFPILQMIEAGHVGREMIHNRDLMVRQLRHTIDTYRRIGDIENEEKTLEMLVSLASIAPVVEGIDTARARLEELRGNKPAPPPTASGQS